MRKYLVSLFISLGILLTPFYKPIIVYSCHGQEMFPEFYASPLIYKSTSLATSLAYDFYFWGLLGNILLWSLALLLVRFVLVRTLLKSGNKPTKYFYNTIKIFIIIYSTISFLTLLVGGNTLQSSINLERYSNDWGMTCEGKFSFTE